MYGGFTPGATTRGRHETFFARRKGAEIVQRVGISVETYDNHLWAAFCSLRHLLTNDADAFA
jgi:hypothetical protein